MIRKTAIITGGFSGIGKATAIKFAKNNYNIALTYHNTFDANFLTELKSFGVDVLALGCDQTKEIDIINFVNSVFKEFEFVDVLICCAGVAETEGMLVEKDTELIDSIINVNFRATILFNREVLRHFMAQKHGTIVNVSSIYGIYGGSLESVYSACKAGIIGLTKSLATEVGPAVRVNAVAPGCVNTKMTENLSKDIKNYVKNQTPLNRIGEPEDIANTIYFLASDEALYITGETILVSGGAIKY